MADKREVSVIIRAKDATQAAFKSALGGISSFASRATSMMTSLSGLIGGAVLGRFFKAAVDESMAAQRAFDQLALTLGNIGVRFADVRPEVDAVFESLRKIAGIDDDEAAGALANLVRLSGDYKKSLAALPLVADLAAGKNIELSAAAEIVGKVMSGNVRGLREFGIMAKDAGQAMTELQEKFAGEAERMGDSFEGVVKRTKEGFNNFLQSVGDLITQNGTARGEVLRLAQAFEHLATWIQHNSDEAGHHFTTLIRFVEALGQTLWGVVRIAFNVGQVVGHVFKDLLNDVQYALVYTLDQLTGFVNGWIETINSLPGPDIAWRAPRFTETLDRLSAESKDLKNQVGDDVGAMGNAVMDVAHAWMRVGEAADAAGVKSREAAVRTRGALGGGSGPPRVTNPGMRDINPASLSDGLNLETGTLTIVPQIEIDSAADAAGMEDMLKPVEDAFADVSANLGATLGDVLGAAFTGGFGAAGETGKQALGNIFSMLGKAMISAGLAMLNLLPHLSNPLTAGAALVAAGVVLTALGASMSKIATGSGASARGVGSAGAPRDVTSALAGSARSTVTVTVPRGQIDPDDPRQRRDWSEFIQSLVQTGDVRINFAG